MNYYNSLVAERAVAHALVQQLDQGAAHVVVVAAVHNLHRQHVQSSAYSVHTVKKTMRNEV